MVIGLGPSGPDLLTAGAVERLAAIPIRFVRTSRHPSASVIEGATSFDDEYLAAEVVEEVYARIVDRLAQAATEHGEVLYAVPGSPLVAERTVELLRTDPRVTVEILPALSFADVAWTRLGVDPLAAGVRLVDGHSFAVDAAGERGPLLVGQCDSRPVLSAIKLAVEGESPPSVTVLQRLGLADEAVFDVEWAELDRSFEPDHLTSLFIPELGAPVAAELVRFAELVRTLRERCPWDRQQTHESLSRHLLEESYEVLDAIASGDLHALEEELGDLLFQVVFHATLGAEEGAFTLADVARGVHDKLVSRHPHVFGSVAAESEDAVVANWEQVKKAEKGRDSVMEGIPRTLPALLYAYKVGRKAAAVGFDWDEITGGVDKVAEELDELRAAMSAEELGDLLFSAVNVARHLEVDPEQALRGATDKFRRRFQHMERLAGERSVPITDTLWDEVKSEG